MASKSQIRDRLVNSAHELDSAFKVALDKSVADMDDAAAKLIKRDAVKLARAKVSLPTTGTRVQLVDAFDGTPYVGLTGTVTPTPGWVRDSVGFPAVIVAFDRYPIGNRRHFAVRGGYLVALPTEGDATEGDATE